MRAETIGEARLNVAADGKRFRCDFIREGPVSYENIGKGIECIRRGTIESRLNSFLGKPLTIEHIDPRLNVADPAVFAQHAHGKVDKVGRDADTGWFFCEGEITTDAGREAALALNPSCGFRVNMTGPGGRWNNVRYERELTDIEFHHLALCSGRARYEEADFRLNAIINPANGDITMFKFVKKILGANGAAATTEEVELPATTVIKIGDKEVRLNEAVDAFNADQAEQAAAAKKKKDDDDAAAAAAGTAGAARENALTDDSEVLVDGKPVKVAVLRQAYEARENAIKAENDRKAEEARLNTARGKNDFQALNTAAAAGNAIRKDFPQTAGTLEEGMKRGKY